MNQFAMLGSEQIAIAGVVAPGALTAGAKNSGWIDLAYYNQLMAVVSTGTLGSSATVDGKWQVADDSSGTNPIDAPGSTALTQILKASGDNKQAAHVLDPSRLTNMTKRFARYVLTVGTATSDAAVVILGLQARHLPVTDNDPTSVVQTVV